MTSAQFCCLNDGVFRSWETVTSPKEAVADHLLKHPLFDRWSSPVQLLPNP